MDVLKVIQLFFKYSLDILTLTSSHSPVCGSAASLPLLPLPALLMPPVPLGELSPFTSDHNHTFILPTLADRAG